MGVSYFQFLKRAIKQPFYVLSRKFKTNKPIGKKEILSAGGKTSWMLVWKEIRSRLYNNNSK